MWAFEKPSIHWPFFIILIWLSLHQPHWTPITISCPINTATAEAVGGFRIIGEPLNLLLIIPQCRPTTDTALLWTHYNIIIVIILVLNDNSDDARLPFHVLHFHRTAFPWRWKAFLSGSAQKADALLHPDYKTPWMPTPMGMTDHGTDWNNKFVNFLISVTYIIRRRRRTSTTDSTLVAAMTDIVVNYSVALDNFIALTATRDTHSLKSHPWEKPARLSLDSKASLPPPHWRIMEANRPVLLAWLKCPGRYQNSKLPSRFMAVSEAFLN